MNNEKAFAYIFVFLTLLAIINWLILTLIELSRVFFWLSAGLTALSIISFIYFLISYIRGEENIFDLDNEAGLITLILFGAIIFFYLFAGACYNAGYSEEAIKAETEAKEYLEDYNLMMNLPFQIIEETIEKNCEDPNYPCEVINDTYQTYKDFIWWKGNADKISKIIINIKKLEN
jgi:hypothetical protein